jgi:wyosine [tRNA(Phe)-imidazoG37] synthetase (radical SAM superfamily)
MKKLEHKEHDFSSKLRQSSVIERLKKYITWQRNAGITSAGNLLPNLAPISINLDLTSACNFSCPHCVDSKIINTGEYLTIEDVTRSLDTLKSHGLLSVILLGGGEPTLHKDFGEIVNYIKRIGLQLGIVTNGSRLGRAANVAASMEKHDWIRVSLDAASQETFEKLHRPKTHVRLDDILHSAREVKIRNPSVSLGYSFVIMWDGLYLNGHELYPNIHEMTDAVRLARTYGFDYISFKPCLIRLPESQKETLLDSVDREKEQHIIEQIKNNFHEAKGVADNKIKVLESVNLRAMMDNKVHELKRQPKICHLQFFNTVVTPSGIFHCPAFRGVEQARIAEFNGYAGEENFDQTLQNLTHSIAVFNSETECNAVGCFYHHVNWWIENFIHSDKSVDELEEIEDGDFFL